MPIKVVIAGFKGRMGQAAYHMVLEDPELELVGLIDPHASENELAGVPVFHDKEGILMLEADVPLGRSCSCNLQRRQLSTFQM